MSRQGIEVFRTRSELRAWRETIVEDVGFVPTMGALHAGHVSLLRRARTENAHSVLSIFVNPTQFGPHEDFSKYPRTWEEDLAVARAEGVDAVFAPEVGEMYPKGASTSVVVPGVSEPLCGRFRPGHFAGVATVVLKLLTLTEPRRAYFGLKDAQQFFVIQRMVQDLFLPVEIIGCPTVRESDGLALSSRNRYLSAAEREVARKLPEALRRLGPLFFSSEPQWSAARDAEIGNLSAAGYRVQYLERRALPDLSEWSSDTRSGLVAVAALLGSTRLIDNSLIVNSRVQWGH
jgi:pantoate--beta-alanine ligase